MRHGATAGVSRWSDVIDAHLHVWGGELLDIAWLTDERSRPLRRAFLLDEAAGMLQTEGIASAVAVTADESEAGSALLLERCLGRDHIAAVVGWIDLTEPDAGTRLDALRAGVGGSALRGVRHVAFGADVIDAAALAPGLRALQERGLVLDLLIDGAALGSVAELCRAAPELDLVVDHLGSPAAAEGTWQASVAQLARHPRAHLKVSGAVVHTSRLPHLLAFARACFGAERLLAGTDWPIHLLSPDVRPWPLLQAATRGWNDHDRTALLGASAARVYGVAA